MLKSKFTVMMIFRQNRNRETMNNQRDHMNTSKSKSKNEEISNSHIAATSQSVSLRVSAVVCQDVARGEMLVVVEG